MNFRVNFQKVKRNYMTLTFDDEREEDGQIKECEKIIHVGMPKKRVFTALMDMQDIINRKKEAGTEKEKNDVDREIIDELYDLTAEILSNNMKGERFTADWVDEYLTIEEIKEFLTQYTKFANGEATNPN